MLMALPKSGSRVVSPAHKNYARIVLRLDLERERFAPLRILTLKRILADEAVNTRRVPAHFSRLNVLPFLPRLDFLPKCPYCAYCTTTIRNLGQTYAGSKHPPLSPLDLFSEVPQYSIIDGRLKRLAFELLPSHTHQLSSVDRKILMRSSRRSGVPLLIILSTPSEVNPLTACHDTCRLSLRLIPAVAC